jgi:hypothetical protein
MTWCSVDKAIPRFDLASSAIRCRVVDRCYGASGDDIGSISGLLTKRWLHRRRCQPSPMEPIDAQAEKAEKAAQRPEPFAYTVRA